MSDPFLLRVARAYSQIPPSALASYCFVFPNKRSATFFRHHLHRCISAGTPYIEPDFIDVAKFVSQFSPLAEASRYESLFTLYNCYTAINGNSSDIPFDRFLFWGEMLINDFNDVDRYLVDPDVLFTNLERIKEIGSTYLTPEQIEIIRRYWGADDAEQQQAADRFWKHLDRKESMSGARFKKLWEVLGSLYHSYIESLEQRGLTTRGRLYRLAAENAGHHTGAAERYVFVGFNVLTTSELKIFRKLKAAGRADFFWDFNSPALNADVNKAGRFIRKNLEEFPPPAEFQETPLHTFPAIDIIGVPSGVGQAKMAAGIIDKWVSEGNVATAEGAINTAVVLPDESLFIPMIHSMPPSVTDMNVTMGFPMRLSPVAAAVGNIWQMQKNARRSDGAVTAYFYEDVRNLLSMPVIQGLDPEGASAINREIKEHRLYNVPPETISTLSPALAPVFAPLHRNAGADATTGYIKTITAHLASQLPATDKLQCHFIESYESAVDNLAAAMQEFGTGMESFTFLGLVNRAVRGDTVNFAGEPLKGLQIMGMLETRALDFENIVILSMNERVFPRKHYSRSFIPDVLRRAFGMATTDFQESIFAYYFYRLISRARRVCMIYDSRTVGGTRSSEMSRYLTQLLYLFPEANARHLAADYSQPAFRTGDTVIRKTPRVMQLLRRFCDPQSGFTLSASSINTYLNCPLQFYLQYVERFNPDDEITDYVDSSTYGSIVHQVMENLYSGLSEHNRPARVTGEFLEIVTRPGHPLLDQLLLEAINNHYHHIYNPSAYKSPVGETLVLSKVIKANIIDLLHAEMAFTPFTFVAAEKRIVRTMRINDKIAVNIKQIIDRIDSITDPDDPSRELTRIVDYKTGADSLDAASVDALFDSSSDTRPKALLQLLFYCHIYAADTGHDGAIQPLLYKMRDIYRGIRPIKIAGNQVTDYRDFMPEFLPLFNRTIEEIFDENVPFTPAATDHSCTFCNFKSLCSRNKQ